MTKNELLETIELGIGFCAAHKRSVVFFEAFGDGREKGCTAEAHREAIKERREEMIAAIDEYVRDLPNV